MLNTIFCPLKAWPGEMTPSHQRKASPFKANYNRTLDLLEFELEKLGARNIVIQCQCDRAQIRNDGWLKSGTSLAGPAIIVSFTDALGDEYAYPCDTFTSFQDNLRAIALALEALRKVDRYGVTRKGEQYQGFKALPPAPQPARAKMTPADAAEFIARYMLGLDPEVVIMDHEIFENAFKFAQKKVHPDAGGSHDDFVKLQEAGAVLAEHFQAQAKAGGQA